jgi:hypothetical protein
MKNDPRIVTQSRDMYNYQYIHQYLGIAFLPDDVTKLNIYYSSRIEKFSYAQRVQTQIHEMLIIQSLLSGLS